MCPLHATDSQLYIDHFLEQNTAFIIMMLIGLTLTVTHTIWIKNIYNRFMKRRYDNMEGFRDSR